MVYEIEQSAGVTTWRVLDSGSPLKAGSYVSFEVVPHPSIPNASLVLHRQFGIFPDSGRMTSYETSDDSKGQNRWWKDSFRHAARLQCALAASAAHPAGA